MTSKEVAIKLLEDVQVITTPGDAFGPAGLGGADSDELRPVGEGADEQPVRPGGHCTGPCRRAGVETAGAPL